MLVLVLSKFDEDLLKIMTLCMGHGQIRAIFAFKGKKLKAK